MDISKVIQEKFEALSGRLDEATLRLWAAVEARTLGRGGVTAVATASGLSRTTIYAGLRELERTPVTEAMRGGSVAVEFGRRVAVASA